MYKTEVETRRAVKELITVELNRQKNHIRIYVRVSMDCCIVNAAEIGISPEGFYDLVYPILKEKGYTLIPTPEGF